MTFFHYNFNTDDLEVLLTIKRDCLVHSCPLHAQPSPYPLQPFTKKQCLLFHPKDIHTPLVDYAVSLERDDTLCAEVQRYRCQTNKVKGLAVRMALLKDEYNTICRKAQLSEDCLSCADTYSRLMPCVLGDAACRGSQHLLAQ